jgi:hypothetical protein
VTAAITIQTQIALILQQSHCCAMDRKHLRRAAFISGVMGLRDGMLRTTAKKGLLVPSREDVRAMKEVEGEVSWVERWRYRITI